MISIDTEFLEFELECHGASLVGVGALSSIPPEKRFNMPVGVSIAVKYPKEVINGIMERPTKEYYDQYHLLNKKLNMLVELGADFISMHGYKAIPLTTNFVEQTQTTYDTTLPHKTVATRAGLGWIGKSALLVTKKYGSMVRLSSILTNAPLKTARPINKSKCGTCMVCTNACPAQAILGKNWAIDKSRSDFYNAQACHKTAREIALQSFGVEITQCGKCIAVCPYTQKYLNS